MAASSSATSPNSPTIVAIIRWSPVDRVNSSRNSRGRLSTSCGSISLRVRRTSAIRLRGFARGPHVQRDPRLVVLRQGDVEERRRVVFDRAAIHRVRSHPDHLERIASGHDGAAVGIDTREEPGRERLTDDGDALADRACVGRMPCRCGAGCPSPRDTDRRSHWRARPYRWCRHLTPVTVGAHADRARAAAQNGDAGGAGCLDAGKRVEPLEQLPVSGLPASCE